jgi:RNA polymerase sigma-70 factor (ECF subfamily)
VTVRAALDVLGEDDREILRLATWEDLDPREIASVLGIPSPTARSRLHRARQRLRRILDDDSDNGSGERPCSTGHVDHDEQALVRDAKDDR